MKALLQNKLILALTLGAVMFRAALALNGEPLWYDEAFSVAVARLPIPRLIEATAGDVHPPAYYIILKGALWLFGNLGLESAPRSLSYWLGGGALCLYALILWRLDLPPKQTAAAWLIALFLPSLVYFSAEARMYALLEVCVLGAVLSLWFLEQAERNPYRYFMQSVTAGLCIGLGTLTHNIGLIYAPVIAITALVKVGKRAWPGVLIAAGVAIIVFTLGWAPVFIGQASATARDYWTWVPNLGTAAYMVFMSLFYIPDIGETAAALLMLVTAALTTYGLLSIRRKLPAVALFPVLMVALTMAASHALGTGLLLHRLLVPCAFFIVIAWADLITRPKLAPLIGVVIVSLVVGNAYFLDGRMGTDYSMWDSLDTQENDIIYANNSAAVPLTIYTDLPVYVTWSDKILSNGLSKQTLDALGMPCRSLELIREWERAWFLWYETPTTDNFERDYKEKITAQYGGVLVKDLDLDRFVNGELWLLYKSGNQQSQH